MYVLPYDFNRVKLKNGQNDYINCSRVATGSQSLPEILVGEISPLTDELWDMIWQEKVCREITFIFRTFGMNSPGSNPTTSPISPCSPCPLYPTIDFYVWNFIRCYIELGGLISIMGELNITRLI